MTSDIEMKLELDCVNALAGAAEVRHRVLAGLIMGDRSIDGTAYLTKCRVKDHRSLARKVMDRRSKRPDYGPGDVRDIVGLRLLTLYKAELPLLVARFLKFIEAGQMQELSIFPGTVLEDAIEEIKIYTSAKEDDPIVSMIIDQFNTKGVPVKAESDVLGVEVERKETEYSSIHIVVWCRNPINSRHDRRIPMEVQIRTSMEDVWGEIDHSLRYKADLADKGSREWEHFQSASKRLGSLKRLLDECGTIADDIRQEMMRADPAGLSSTTHVSAGTVHLETLSQLPLRGQLQKRVGAVADQIRIAFTSFFKGGVEAKAGLPAEFTAIGTELLDLVKAVKAEEGLSREAVAYCRYYLMMEAALAYYWAGRVASGLHDTAYDETYVAEQMALSLKLYGQLSQDPAYRYDAILGYRMANVMMAQGSQEDLAVIKLKEAVRNLDNHPQGELEDDHFLRVRIPRQLGLAYWELAENLRLREAPLGAEESVRSEQREYYLKALRTTKPLLDRKVAPSREFEDAASHEPTDDRLHTVNNLLEYSLCFLRAGGDLAVLAKDGIDTSVLRGYCDLLAEEVFKKGTEMPIWADTLRAAHLELFEEVERAQDAAKLVKSMIMRDKIRFVTVHGGRVVEEMLEDAEATLRG
ncbi:hypothetical protein [Jannaschia aquimarina]|uniref:RelA/SpoT domain-containing protein n=1 Tax=Jannaschia aquimarina TaxID=935700 RepID=A0A0D1EI81_9RHOB|nr:hypothetical protein [Jannaschia aquimarina]KIT15560.1 hypothetical protein jaqu_26570 [Jannaschia aquimarina]SNT26948.1 hypothetical protein SAMN05421775_109111 [Jannaschia aquimarina]